MINWDSKMPSGFCSKTGLLICCHRWSKLREVSHNIAIGTSFSSTGYRRWLAENCRTVASCSPECILGDSFWFVSICFTFEKLGDDFDAKATKIGPFLIEAIPRLEIMTL